MFWLIAAALAGVVGLSILAPFLRRGGEAVPPAAAHDLALYRGQMAEIDRDLGRGVILPEEAERLRLEVGRRALEADREMRGAEAGRAGRPVPVAVIAVLLAVLSVGAFALYRQTGAPELGDMPMSWRLAEAETAYGGRPSQAEAEAQAAEVRRPQPAPEDVTLAEQLRARLAERPDDAQGWALLAGQEARIGEPVRAVEAQRRAMALRQPAAADHALLAGLLVEAAGGIVTSEAEAEVAAALRLDPAEPQARFLRGLLMVQTLRPDLAYAVWRDLPAEAPADAPWLGLVRASLPDLAWLAGQPEPEAGAAAAPLPGPDAAAIAAAEAMPEAERQQMIQGMVASLEQRLGAEGGPPEEWARLIVALSVIGNRPRAEAILTEARGQFGAVPAASGVIEAAARQAGLP